MFCKNCGNQVGAQSQFCSNCGQGINDSLVSSSQFRVASAGVRLLNFIIDYFVSLALFFAVVFFVQFLFRDEVAQVLVGVLAFLYIPIYYLIFEWLWQRTLGKVVTGTKVVMLDGSKPHFRYILGRSFARIIPFEALSFLAGPIGWHDSLSRTLVVPKGYSVEDVNRIDKQKHNQQKTKTVLIVAVCFLIVIAIIGFLSSVVLLSLNSARAKSRDAKRVSDVRQLATALELYFNDNNEYPKSLSQLVPDYINPLPIASIPSDGECSLEQNEYGYRYISDNNFSLSFCLGATSGGYDFGVHELTPAGVDVQVPESNVSSQNNIVIEAVSEIKASMSFPSVIDEVTTLTTVTAQSDSVRFHYQLSGADISNIENGNLKSVIAEGLCANADVVSLFEKGVGVEYFYNVTETAETYLLSFTSSDCVDSSSATRSSFSN